MDLPVFSYSVFFKQGRAPFKLDYTIFVHLSEITAIEAPRPLVGPKVDGKRRNFRFNLEIKIHFALVRDHQREE